MGGGGKGVGGVTAHDIVLVYFQTKKYADIIIPRGSENKGIYCTDNSDTSYTHTYLLLQLPSM